MRAQLGFVTHEHLIVGQVGPAECACRGRCGRIPSHGRVRIRGCERAGTIGYARETDRHPAIDLGQPDLSPSDGAALHVVIYCRRVLLPALMLSDQQEAKPVPSAA